MGVTLEEMAAHLRRTDRERRARGEERARALRAKLPEARRILVEVHGASSVRLFGSLAGGRVMETSDVDLAVRGLSPERYFTALADLMELFRGPLDLVRVEEAPPSLAERIAAEGEAL
jgi:predicted nucleotidyltransferase